MPDESNAAGTAEVLTAVPANWHLVWDVHVRRAGLPVRVRRWQPTAERRLGGEQVTVTTGARGGRLLAVRRYVTAELAGMHAERSAASVFDALDPRYSRGLVPLRVDHQQRSWTAADGTVITTAIEWAKFGHRNGTYNWVSIAPNNALVEYEVESHWDYARGRRATEQWDFDPWIAAREGIGPQLEPPNALA